MYIATNTPSKYLTGTIGAYISNKPLTGSTTDMLLAGPQILDNTPKTAIGNLEWFRVAGNIQAKGGEEYLTIGSFYKTPPFLGFYYLFVDDVKLMPVKLELGADTTLCTGDQLVLQVPASDASRYQWQDGSRQNTFTVKQTGAYSITVTQDNCVATDTIQVKFIQPPKLDLGPDKELCGAQTFTIRPTFAEGTFSWQDQFAQHERTVSTAGVFWASVRNDCATVTDSIQIDYGACDCVLYAPNSFTPNGDGLNDSFLAYGCGDIRITSLLIFNRWGEVVYKTTVQPFQWDGRYRGEICEPGVYAWRIQYELHHGRKVKLDQSQGSLTLIH